MSGSTATTVPDGPRPRVIITCCTRCRWLSRATWPAGELRTSSTTALGRAVLRPGVGGVVTVMVDDDLVWDRVRDGGLGDPAPPERLVPDRVAPAQSLGPTGRDAGQAG